MNEKSRNYRTATNEDDKGSVTEQVKEKASDAFNEAKPMVDEASRQAHSSLTEQKEAAVHQLSGFANALRQSSDQLREQDQGAFASYSQQAADQIEQMSGYLRDRDLKELMHDAEDFARQQPELFIGGAFTLGLLAARFLKSSTPNAQQRREYETNRRNRAASSTHFRENERNDRRNEREDGITNPIPSMTHNRGETTQRIANGY